MYVLFRFYNLHRENSWKIYLGFLYDVQTVGTCAECLEFIKALHFLIQNNIIKLEIIPANTNETSEIPDWIRENAGWWADNRIGNQDFVSGLQYMMENGIIVIEIPKSLEEIQKEKETEFILF